MNVDIHDAADTEWDAIVVGGGMGGCAAARRLTDRGLCVLLIERGLSEFDLESTSITNYGQDDPDERLKSAKWPTKLDAQIDGIDSSFYPALGCGVGGSTLLYAAALQRLHKSDFETRESPAGELSWPISYHELTSYYVEMEKLFSVRGDDDPLGGETSPHLLSPLPIPNADRTLMKHLKSVGLNPYRLHVGYGAQPDCDQCGGKVCARQCKRDARSCLVGPISDSPNLSVLTSCKVLKVAHENKRVTGVIACNSDGAQFEFTSEVVVLAAGAYVTPGILLNSDPDGAEHEFANRSGLIGKNLMFHVSDFFAVWSERNAAASSKAEKSIALRDFYDWEGTRLGEVQSTGMHADYPNIYYALRLMAEQNPIFKITAPFLRIPAYVASKLFGQAIVLATIVEDFPYPTNRVYLQHADPTQIRIEYRLSDELRARTRQMRSLIKKQFSPMRTLPLNPKISLNFGHALGTCRAGNDPATSVVDHSGRSHDVENLYIVDGSIFPTSGGTNPSLTIGAMALRSADHIADHMTASSGSSA